MVTTMKEATAIQVKVLDLSELEVAAFKKMSKKEYPEATRCRADKIGIVETVRGIYALDSEGVGQSAPISASNKCHIDIWAEWDNGGYCFSAMTAKLTDEDLKRLPVKETVNLADFIRSFGARLETNYEAWRKALES